MNWYVVDKDYIRYLIQFDSRVGYVEYGEKLKLHVGVLLTVNDCHYYVPISSAKPKHQRMSNSLDFHKLQDADTGYLYATILPLTSKLRTLHAHFAQTYRTASPLSIYTHFLPATSNLSPA